MTSTRIKRMKLKSPYAAVVATKEGIEAKVSHSGFSLFYANTWEGIRRDCNLLAEKIRRPHGEPPTRFQMLNRDPFGLFQLRSEACLGSVVSTTSDRSGVRTTRKQILISPRAVVTFSRGTGHAEAAVRKTVIPPAVNLHGVMVNQTVKR